MPFTLTIVSVSDSGLRYLDQAIANLSKDKQTGQTFQSQVTVKLHFVGLQQNYEDKLDQMKDDIRISDMVMLDLMGGPASVVAMCESMSAGFKGNFVVLGAGTEVLRSHIRLGKFRMAALKKMMHAGKGRSKETKSPPMDMEKMLSRMETLGRIVPVGPLKDMRNWILLGKYWHFAGPENARNMLMLICRTYGGLNTLPAPGALIDYARYVLFDPKTLCGFDTLQELRDAWGWDENRQTIGLLFYNFNYPNHTAGVLSRIIRRLKFRYNVIPLGISTGSDKFKQLSALMDNGLKMDLLWNFLPFRFGAGPMGGDSENGLDIFRKLNVPVLHPFFLGKRNKEQWTRDVRGLSPMEVMIQILLPELDGVIDTIPVAALEPCASDKMDDLQALRLMEGRLKRLLARSEMYLRLRNRPNEEKRIAFVLYNYPPGEGNVGSGAFLDTFSSMARITTALKTAGYACDPVTVSQLESVFMTSGVCNCARWHLPDAVTGRYPVEAYQCGDDLHRMMTARISREWKAPPGQVMADTDGFLIPGLMVGNLFIGLQPSRGNHEDSSKQYHDKELPPHHQYSAFYRWLAEEFKADAVVHVGTHGTLEFLPGKESGMSDTCFPDYLIGALPHFYLYYSGNPAEATIAKRRTHGCLISYSGPPFKPSGLYGDAAELANLIDEHAESKSLSPHRQAQLEKRILDQAVAMKLSVAGEMTVDAIAGELIRMKHMLMPAGLHEIGRPFSRRTMAGFLYAMLGWERGKLRALPEILRETTRRKEQKNKTIGSHPSISKEDNIHALTHRLIENYYFGDRSHYADLCRHMTKPARSALDAVLAYGSGCLQRIHKTDEIDGLLKALNGDYVEARLGGDLIRDPDVFPTGHNLFQFDPRRVPSETAMARGREIAESTLRYYREHHDGAYPESVSVVLWGLETSRTRGETIGQIMAYLGVRLNSAVDSFEKKFDVVPLEELGRPRIDCLTTICGFFRDMYPTLIDFLDDAFDTVAGRDEPEEQNFVRKHSRHQYRELVQHTDEQTAKEMSRARIFGPAQDQYGTGLTTVINSGNWQEETELAAAYLTAQKHIYTRSRRGEPQEDLFTAGLKHVDLVSQVRSSVDYTFMDLDHYYEFFGGLSRSIEAVRGKKPEMLVTDSASTKIFTDDAGKAIEIGVRTRLLNPDYIEEMLKHKVHGAQQINQRMENLVGLSATTGRVETWIFDKIKETYFDDAMIYAKLRCNNLYATAEMMMRLMESWRRGYWQAREKDIQELKEKYVDLEGEIEKAADESP